MDPYMSIPVSEFEELHTRIKEQEKELELRAKESTAANKLIYGFPQFAYALIPEAEVRKHIQSCEGQHVQQVIFSTFMDTLTQICFTEQVIRSSIQWEGNRSWKAA